MMKKSLICILVIFLTISWCFAQEDAATEETQRTFVGTQKCGTCHKGKMAEKKATTSSLEIWSGSAHANAYLTLAGDEAKAIAAGLEIEDAQKADECLKCHVTGHGVAAEFLGKKYSVEDGVGCESCHGPGGDYYKMKVMKAITAGETDGASVGLLTSSAETCTGCHNEDSPTFEASSFYNAETKAYEFDFEAGMAKIAHPIMPE